jgi:hypothetical protein
MGRTGTLIGLYLMARHGLTARSAIAWMRLCRIGMVDPQQQKFLIHSQVGPGLAGAGAQRTLPPQPHGHTHVSHHTRTLSGSIHRSSSQLLIGHQSPINSPPVFSMPFSTFKSDSVPKQGPLTVPAILHHSRDFSSHLGHKETRDFGHQRSLSGVNFHVSTDQVDAREFPRGTFIKNEQKSQSAAFTSGLEVHQTTARPEFRHEDNRLIEMKAIKPSEFASTIQPDGVGRQGTFSTDLPRDPSTEFLRKPSTNSIVIRGQSVVAEKQLPFNSVIFQPSDFPLENLRQKEAQKPTSRTENCLPQKDSLFAGKYSPLTTHFGNIQNQIISGKCSKLNPTTSTSARDRSYLHTNVDHHRPSNPSSHQPGVFMKENAFPIQQSYHLNRVPADGGLKEALFSQETSTSKLSNMHLSGPGTRSSRVSGNLVPEFIPMPLYKERANMFAQNLEKHSALPGYKSSLAARDSSQDPRAIRLPTQAQVSEHASALPHRDLSSLHPATSKQNSKPGMRGTSSQPFSRSGFTDLQSFQLGGQTAGQKYSNLEKYCN